MELNGEMQELRMTLLMIRDEVTDLRAEVVELDLPESESLRFLGLLAMIEQRAAKLLAKTVAQHRGH
jgi:hypothetical protein